MFTGLIEDVGVVEKLDPRGSGARLRLKTAIPLSEIAIGESIAVDGACLTVVDLEKNGFCVDLGRETMGRTTARRFEPGRRVNLERAARLGDRLGGHLVTGHVDGVGVVERVEKTPDFVMLRVRAPEEVARYLVEKGSIALQGVSLSLNSVKSEVFTVGLIPHTLANTNLIDLRQGDEVNLEADLIAKYIEKFFQSARGGNPEGLTRDFLAKHGFDG